MTDRQRQRKSGRDDFARKPVVDYESAGNLMNPLLKPISLRITLRRNLALMTA
jgi:hypothetical protein